MRLRRQCDCAVVPDQADHRFGFAVKPGTGAKKLALPRMASEPIPRGLFSRRSSSMTR